MNYHIRPASRKEMDIIIQWARNEDWNPGLFDADSFYTLDPKGYLLGFYQNEPVASISAVSYNSLFGFIGFYIVKPSHRGRGLGFKIWQQAIKKLSTQSIGLDAVVAQQKNYLKSGFKIAHKNIRYKRNGLKLAKKIKEIIPLTQTPFSQLLEYDEHIFPATRPHFLKSWIIQPQSHAVGLIENNTLKGYGVVRKCIDGYKVGPLFADNSLYADKIFAELLSFVDPNQSIRIDIPDINKSAQLLIKNYSLTPIFETARMYTKNPPNIPIHKVFGQTTLEIG